MLKEASFAQGVLNGEIYRGNTFRLEKEMGGAEELLFLCSLCPTSWFYQVSFKCSFLPTVGRRGRSAFLLNGFQLLKRKEHQSRTKLRLTQINQKQMGPFLFQKKIKRSEAETSLGDPCLLTTRGQTKQTPSRLPSGSQKRFKDKQ